MTKYEYKKEKKQKRIEKRLARKTKRREKRELKSFERKSNAKYRIHHRLMVKSLRVGGPILGFGYAAYKLYSGLFLNMRGDQLVNGIDLKVASMLLVAGVILLGFALWFGFKYLKTAIAANAVARNQGIPSLSYSPVVITSIRAVLSTWLFGLLYLFNYIGINYGESLNNGFKEALIAFTIGFGLLLTGDIVEQSILHKVRNQKHRAEDETRLMIYELSKEED